MDAAIDSFRNLNTDGLGTIKHDHQLLLEIFETL